MITKAKTRLQDLEKGHGSINEASCSHSWNYDVFLSFRGEDTRKNFVDHLYAALDQQGINTYKDDEKLQRGESIGPSLFKAIKGSKIAVIVFSKNYASSSWCLDELDYIMKCRRKRGQIVMPIFYDVEPSEVRKQKWKYEEAFAQHELENNSKVDIWRKALVDASNLAGWEPKHVADGHEAKGIKKFVDTISDQLFSLNPNVSEGLVGMETRSQYLKSQLQIGSGGVRMVGIWGIGGGGKTTLASSVYLEIARQFEGHCIVDNTREESHKNGLKALQEKILSSVLRTEVRVQSVEEGKHKIQSRLGRKKVLILLDDVDDRKQLEALAGSHNWFGDGSRIIITTRDEHLLRSHEVDVVSSVSLLSDDEAIRLFNRYAFHGDKPIEDYEKLSQSVVSYCGGLPLTVRILGSYLFDKDKFEWKSILERLKKIPPKETLEKLQISYDALEADYKNLFLDVACMVRGFTKEKAMVILDSCGFYPGIGLRELEQKSLITTSNGRLEMHNLLQEMGHYIVRRVSLCNPEKHSRVWETEVIDNMCYELATTENNEIEAIKYDGESPLFCKAVSNMKKLRLLMVTCYNGEDVEGPKFLSNELRYIHWHSYPASPLPANSKLRKLVVLMLHHSLQEELWEGYKCLPALKELELIAAHRLLRTPDFGGMPCLQKLKIEYCGCLEEIHPSLGSHESIVSIYIKGCDKLRKFPTIIWMERLEILEISSCEALREFPEIQSNMVNLVNLCLYKVGIEVLPSSIGEYCTNLVVLKLVASNLNRIEGNFRALKNLCEFEFTGSTHLEKLPKDLFDEKCCLNELSLPEMRQKIPPWGCLGFPHLSRFLKRLNLCYCGLKDGEIPCDIGELFNLQELDLSENLISRIHFSLSQLTQLKILNLTACYSLTELPELPSSIAILKADKCHSLKAVGDFHTNCIWLCQVSLMKGSIVIGGNRLLQSMLQGKAIENHCMSLQLEGLEIPKNNKKFIPRLLSGTKCTLQLPENYCNDFCGFLMCAVVKENYGNYRKITMKHKKGAGRNSQQVLWDKSAYGVATWLGYVSFGSLRQTSWWDQTCDVVSFSMNYSYADPGHKSDSDDRCEYMSDPCVGFGVKLIPKRSKNGLSLKTKATTDGGSEFYDEKYDFKNNFRIRYDSDSVLEIVF